MKFAICQMNVVQGDRIQNEQTATKMIAEAAEEHADVIVLPEMWKSGYDFTHLARHVESIDGATASFLADQAKKYGVYLVGGSFTLQEAGKVYNMSFSFNPQGELINRYAKLHLIGLMQEDKYLTAGEDYQSFKLGESLASLIICYDLRFPELIRTYAVEGADILFVPAQWPIQREEHWLTLLRARAIENQMFVVGANIIGQNQHDHFNGQSIIFDPWGEVVARADNQEQILYADIALDKVTEVRKSMPVFQDRVPHRYRIN